MSEPDHRSITGTAARADRLDPRAVLVVESISSKLPRQQSDATRPSAKFPNHAAYIAARGVPGRRATGYHKSTAARFRSELRLHDITPHRKLQARRLLVLFGAQKLAKRGSVKLFPIDCQNYVADEQACPRPSRSRKDVRDR